MKIYFGNEKTEHGTGVQIDLTGDEVATAIYTYLAAHDVNIQGAATVSVNGELCKEGGIYVDPSGFVLDNGNKWSGIGTHTPTEVETFKVKPYESDAESLENLGLSKKDIEALKTNFAKAIRNLKL